ncbi:hypothetical protein BDP67DRAFT_493015 [Colletotrichum lupini]|nr:hypothetical protein BDP67DRAFT_493015 [Colletotrichum lupini]
MLATFVDLDVHGVMDAALFREAALLDGLLPFEANEVPWLDDVHQEDDESMCPFADINDVSANLPHILDHVSVQQNLPRGLRRRSSTRSPHHPLPDLRKVNIPLTSNSTTALTHDTTPRRAPIPSPSH